jgi:hypothetical protein
MSKIFEIGLRPILSNADLPRLTKYVYNPYTYLLPYTLTEFTQQFEPINRCFFNFTDVLYYVTDDELLDLSKKMNIGLIGTFTMHLIEQGNYYLTFVEELGEVKIKKGRNISMQVIGNTSIYEHETRFIELINNDKTYIGNGDNIIEITKERAFVYKDDKQKSKYYICGVLMKVPTKTGSIVPSLQLHNQKQQLQEEAMQLNIDYNAVEAQTMLSVSRNPNVTTLTVFANLMSGGKRYGTEKTPCHKKRF